MHTPQGAPGFLGKLRSHGDFVTRRLPLPVRDRFDRWLQAALLQSRIDLGDAWLPTWLSSPLWRFLVAPGVCGEQAWAGVMMPSHDRVGRCFPLLLAAPVDGMPSLRDCMTLHAGWFARLEELALSTLEEGFSLDGFDAALMAMDGAPSGGTAPRLQPDWHGAAGRAPGKAVVLEPVGGVFAPLSASLAEGDSAWWTDGSPLLPPCLAICGGLPAPAAFSALLDGRWRERGWNPVVHI